MQFTHFIITRYNLELYNRPAQFADQWMHHRLHYFQSCRDSVLSQNADFRWIVMFDERTPWNWITKVCTDPRMKPFIGYPADFPYAESCDTDWIITTRLDNDDRYLPGALAAIQAQFNPMVMCIDIDYFGYNNLHYYTSNRGTPTSFFISLVEPRETAIGVYYTQHNLVRTSYPVNGEPTRIPEVMIKQPYAVMVVHGNNQANKIEGRRVDALTLKKYGL